MNWTLCFSFFNSLKLAHLEHALYALSRQTVKPSEFLFLDNNSPYAESEVLDVIRLYFSPEQMRIVFDKHGDLLKTGSYANNRLIREATHDLIVFTRADLILDFDFCEAALKAQGGSAGCYASAWMFQMPLLSKASFEEADYAHDLDPLNWREDPKRLLQNNDGAQGHTRPDIDSAAFCMHRSDWENAGGYDEHLNTWGFWSMNFQTELGRRGVRFVTIPEFKIYHMLHALPKEEGERDLRKAHQQFEMSPRRNDPAFQ